MADKEHIFALARKKIILKQSCYIIYIIIESLSQISHQLCFICPPYFSWICFDWWEK